MVETSCQSINYYMVKEEVRCHLHREVELVNGWHKESKDCHP